MKHLNAFEDCLIASGVTISLIDLQTILGIIILSFQIVLILFKVGKRIYNAIKKKDINEIENAFKDGVEDLQNISDSVSKK